MTNQEAIEILKNGTMFMPTLENSKYLEAFDLAIKALENETPQGDLISREALKKACAEVVKSSNNSDFIPCPTWNDAMDLIDNAPAVNPCKNCDLYFKAMTKEEMRKGGVENGN